MTFTTKDGDQHLLFPFFAWLIGNNSVV